MTRRDNVQTEAWLAALTGGPAHAEANFGYALSGDVAITWDLPDTLIRRLLNLQLLHSVPFVYLVPDGKALPAESLRFFYLDPNWVDHLVQGVLSAATIGTLDHDQISDGFLDAVNEAVDEASPITARWAGASVGVAPVTGMLLRSRLVKAYQQLEIEAFKLGKAVKVLRQERLSDGVMLVLFADLPTKVTLEEPKSGTSFGLIRKGSTGLGVQVRKTNTSVVETRRVGTNEVEIDAPLRGSGHDLGVVDIAALRERLKAQTGQAHGITSGELALHLQHAPYRAVLETSTGGGKVLEHLPADLLNRWNS